MRAEATERLIHTDRSVSYRPRNRLRWWLCLGALLFGGLAAIGQWARPDAAGAPEGRLRDAWVAGVLLLFGVWLLLSILRGVPRLTLDRDGITLQGLIRRRSARWAELGPFTPTSERVFFRTILRAAAPSLAPRGRRFVLQDVFETPLPAIVADLPRWRGAAAVAPAADEPRPWGVAGFRWPWLTTALLLVFIAVFVVESRAAARSGQAAGVDIRTLIALGGVSRDLVLAGQAYRLLSAPFLHASLAHLVGNGVAFALGGYTLERLLGRAWMFCVFALGALAGSVASIVLNPPGLVSVGASGAIMAMLATLIVTSFRMPPGQRRSNVQIQSARIAVPALIPLGNGALHIDYAAHTGGAMLGLALGSVLLGTWRPGAPLPRFRRGAAAAAALCAIGFVFSFLAVAQHYPVYAAAERLIPPAQLPHGQAEIEARADALLALYPRDPRARLFEAMALLRRGDKAGAERELRTALALIDASPGVFAPSFATVVRTMLAATVLDEGRRAEAAAIARDACVAGAVQPPQMAAALAQTHLCDGLAPPVPR